MYSPKIPERLIPSLYRTAHSRGLPMTRLVADVLESYLASQDQDADDQPRDRTGMSGNAQRAAKPSKNKRSSESSRSSPGKPNPILRGVRFVLDLKRVLPQPPLPPLATNKVCPSTVRSPNCSPVSISPTTVPIGTAT